MDLKHIREQKGLTQIDVAKAVGVSLAAYRLWELGVGKPNQENQKRLLKFLGVE